MAVKPTGNGPHSPSDPNRGAYQLLPKIASCVNRGAQRSVRQVPDAKPSRVVTFFVSFFMTMSVLDLVTESVVPNGMVFFTVSNRPGLQRTLQD